MAKVSALKTGKAAGPPEPTEAPTNLNNPPRDKPERRERVYFNMPADIAEGFDAEAARLFGFKKGAKTQMFRRLWEVYQNQKNG